MARAPRQFVAGGIYHVYSRGSNRQAIFAFDSDRLDFLYCLERAVRNVRASCLAYCLMPNHYHLVVETHDGMLSTLMQSLNGGYANRFNRRYKRDAHLFSQSVRRCSSGDARTARVDCPVRRHEPRHDRPLRPPGRMAVEQLPTLDRR